MSYILEAVLHRSRRSAILWMDKCLMVAGKTRVSYLPVTEDDLLVLKQAKTVLYVGPIAFVSKGGNTLANASKCPMARGKAIVWQIMILCR
jgi:hypothetical protein